MPRHHSGLARRAAQGNAHDELRVPFHTAGEALGRSRTERKAELAKVWMIDGPLDETTNRINRKGERVPAQLIRHRSRLGSVAGGRTTTSDDEVLLVGTPRRAIG